MGILHFLGIASSLRRVAAYVVETAPDGREHVVPLGTIPAPAKSCENRLRRSHDLRPGDYVYDEIDQYPIVAHWHGDTVDALCFESSEVALMYPGFERLTREQLQGPFEHFASWSTDGNCFFNEPWGEDALEETALLAS